MPGRVAGLRCRSCRAELLGCVARGWLRSAIPARWLCSRDCCAGTQPSCSGAIHPCCARCRNPRRIHVTTWGGALLKRRAIIGAVRAIGAVAEAIARNSGVVPYRKTFSCDWNTSHNLVAQANKPGSRTPLNL